LLGVPSLSLWSDPPGKDYPAAGYGCCDGARYDNRAIFPPL